MKRLFLLFILINLSCAQVCYSQNGKTSGKYLLKVGLKAGFSFPNFNASYADSSITSDTRRIMSYILGGIVNIPLSETFSIRTGLELVRKGAVEITDSYNYTYRQRSSYTFIDLPINLIYMNNNKGGLLAGGGVVIGHTSGHGYSNIYPSPFDVGVNVLAGYELPIGFSIMLNYSQGLKNVSNNKSYMTNLKNNYFGLTVGYMF